MAYYSTLRRTLASLSSRRSFFHYSSSSSSASLSRVVSNPKAPVRLNHRPTGPANNLARFSSTGSDHTPLENDDDDATPRWFNTENGVDGEEVVIDGCDFEHWLVIFGFPEGGDLSEEEMVNAYVSTLAKVVGSEEEARKKIYSVSTVTYTGFGALISREVSQKLKGLPGVLWVLPDSYIDVPTKDYGGDLYVDGKVIHRPEFRFPNVQSEPMGSDSDDNKYKEHIMEDELENKQLEMQAELWRNMLKTRKKEPRLRTETLERSPEGNVDTESDDEETQELLVRARGKETEVVTEEASKSNTEESEGTKVSNGLQDLFTKLREKVKNVNIETVQSSNQELDLANLGDDCLEQTEDPDKPKPDLNKLKEAVQSFRLGLKLRKDDEVNRYAEATDWLRENLELIKRTDSELFNQQPVDFEETRGLKGSEDSEIPHQDLDKIRGIMNAMRREPMKSGNDDNSGSPADEIEGSEGHFSLLDRPTENSEREGESMQHKPDGEMSPAYRAEGSNDEPAWEQEQPKSGDSHEALK